MNNRNTLDINMVRPEYAAALRSSVRKVSEGLEEIQYLLRGLNDKTKEALLDSPTFIEGRPDPAVMDYIRQYLDLPASQNDGSQPDFRVVCLYETNPTIKELSDERHTASVLP